MALSKITRTSLNTGIDDNSDATAITIDSSENVGIGTTSPDTSLHISADASARFRVEDTTNNVKFDVLAQNSDVKIGTNSNHDLRVMTNNTERMRIDTDGGLRVGTTTNIFNLSSTEHVSIKNPGQGNALTLQSTNVTGGFPILYLSSTDTTASQNAVVFQRTGGGVGTITTTASSTAYNTTSDYRLKENVADMTGAITRVKQLAPKRFNFISDPDDTTVDGFLAHEAQTVVPEAVTGTHNEVDDDGNAVMQGIDQSKLVPLLVGALKESITKIETLETEMTALKARVTTLENA